MQQKLWRVFVVFQEQAVKRGISLDAERQQRNVHFCDYMQVIMKQPYTVQAVVFWSVENAYCQVRCAQKQQ